MTGDEQRTETSAATPPPTQLEEENPVESPAQPAGDDDPDAARERASTTASPESQTGESTEGLTVGGTEKSPPGA